MVMMIVVIYYWIVIPKDGNHPRVVENARHAMPMPWLCHMEAAAAAGRRTFRAVGRFSRCGDLAMAGRSSNP